MNRRTFAASLTAVAAAHAQAGGSGAIYLGSGTKAGEIRDTSAILHVRLTKTPGQDGAGLIPGAKGQVRVRYGIGPEMRNAATTQVVEVGAGSDYSTQFPLRNLRPATRYYYVAEYRASKSGRFETSRTFSFPTAPPPQQRQPVKFQVTTGQDIRGESTYASMEAQKPHFLVATGDNVYYDGQGNAHTVEEAYQAYQKMYGLPLMKRYYEHIGGYFEKDDHDYRFNDSDRWQKFPGGDGGRAVNSPRARQRWLTHEEGILVFKQVFPMSDLTYRTFRWGKGVQIWLLEGRDFRSPNNATDGPEKTIWGPAQKAWLKQTLLSSDADWRVVISPTPIIGPDRSTKTDNHANRNGFWREGQEFLDWLRDERLPNAILICGDRHWQYHSLDQRQGRKIHEFSCGPTCDEHTQKVPPIGPEFEGVTQPYAASIGGFLTVSYRPDRTLTFAFYDAKGKEVYRRAFAPGS